MLRNTVQYFNHTADKSEECKEQIYRKEKFQGRLWVLNICGCE